MPAPIVSTDDDNFITVDVAKPCLICQKLCKTIEVNFEAHLHTKSCAAEMWARYVNELQKYPASVEVF